jgi:hypothetical protein
VSGCAPQLEIWIQQVQQGFGGAIVMLLAQFGIADAPIGIPTLSDNRPGRKCGRERCLSQRERGNAVPLLVLISEIGDKDFLRKSHQVCKIQMPPNAQ